LETTVKKSQRNQRADLIQVMLSTSYIRIFVSWSAT